VHAPSLRFYHTGVPHSGQNLPVTSVPHFGHLFGPTATKGVPHSGQNFPLLSVPHFGHFILPLGAGAGAPHSGQNLPVIIVPHFGQGTP
jgi:hypothetical protein